MNTNFKSLLPDWFPIFPERVKLIDSSLIVMRMYIVPASIGCQELASTKDKSIPIAHQLVICCHDVLEMEYATYSHLTWLKKYIYMGLRRTVNGNNLQSVEERELAA